MNWGPGETKSPSDPKALTPTVSLCWPKSNDVDADIRPGNDDHLRGEGDGKNGKTGNDSRMQCLEEKTRTRNSPLSQLFRVVAFKFRATAVIHQLKLLTFFLCKRASQVRTRFQS